MNTMNGNTFNINNSNVILTNPNIKGSDYKLDSGSYSGRKEENTCMGMDTARPASIASIVVGFGLV
jgi:hypothetical protein